MTADQLAAALRAARLPCIGGIFADERGAEFLLGVARRTLRTWRTKRKGPPAVQTARWLYDLNELAAWLNANKTHRPIAAETGPARPKAAIAVLSPALAKRENF